MQTASASAPWSRSALAGLVALAAYLWLAPSVSADRDASEFALVLAFDGIAHPTGYPLYTLFGHWFGEALAHLGVSWPVAANAWSAMGGAIAIGLMHPLAARLIPGDRPVPGRLRVILPFLPLALLALNPVWVGVTTVAEVYSWHQAWVMGVCLYFVVLMGALATERAASPTERARSGAHAAGWGLLCGVGLAHHLTAVLIAAPLTGALVLAERAGWRQRVRHAALAAAAAVIPLSAYLLLWAKAMRPGPAQWPMLEPTWGGWWRHVTGRQYWGDLGGFAPAGLERQLLDSAVYPFLFPGLLLLAAALVLARGRHARLTAGALAAAAMLQTAFSFTYAVGDPSAYFLPPLALGLVALAPVLGIWSAAGRGPRRATAAAAAALGVVSVLLNLGWARGALEMRSAYEGLDRMLRSMWGSIRVERGIVLWRGDMYQRLLEYQLLRGEKRGLEVLNPWMFTDPVVRRRFASRHGFDPLGDLRLARSDVLATGPESEAARQYFEALARRVAARGGLPVVVFDPLVPEVRVLARPTATPEAAAADPPDSARGPGP